MEVHNIMKVKTYFPSWHSGSHHSNGNPEVVGEFTQDNGALSNRAALRIQFEKTNGSFHVKENDPVLEPQSLCTAEGEIGQEL